MPPARGAVQPDPCRRAARLGRRAVRAVDCTVDCTIDCTYIYISIYLYIYGAYGVPGSLSMGPYGVPGSRDSWTQDLGSRDSGSRT